MTKPHWFPFYVSDFLGSPTVTLMSAEEVGGYVLLLCYAWQDPHGSLPTDDDSLRVLSRVKGDLSRIKSCFAEKKGRLYNTRLAQELEKAKEKSDLAKRSNAIRWQYERNASVMRTQSSSQSQSQSQSQSEKEVKISASASPRGGTLKSVEAWEAYKASYHRRYGIDPVRNQQVNSLLGKLVDKLGATDAPHVAAFYVTHNSAWYVQKGHAVNLLLADAEKLRTEWATGMKITSSAVKNAELKDNVVEQVKRVEALMKGRTE